MKFKNGIILITLTIVILFTISSVCAEDSDIQDISAYNSTDMVCMVNDNGLENNIADEILAETDDFVALNEAINGDPSKNYIELEKDYHGHYDGGNGIQIDRDNVVIDGKGHTIDCTGENSRMFYVTADGITLKNIIFSGGSSDRGGAVYSNKNLTVMNCTFRDNQATGTADEYGGGAICGYHAKMGIYDCTFISNHASLNGGAIAAVGGAPDDYEIFNCTFIDNAADGNGGAFYSHADWQMGNIINSTFTNNRASAGDAVYNYGYAGTIDRCVFINNTANSMICGPYAEMIVSNSIIVNNYGDKLIDIETPAIDYNWWGTTADDEEAPVVSGQTLTNYYVLDMTMDDDSADITLNNLYDNGVMTTSYGGYDLPSINLTLKAVNVEVADTVTLGPDGTATVEHAPSDAYEITVGYNGVELTRVVKPTFKGLMNKINSEGSEISLEQDYIYDSAKDSYLTNGIEFAKDMTIDGQGHIIDANKSSNIFYFDDDTNSYSLTLKNIVFANATRVDGAAVYFKGNRIEIINCTFTNNKADCEGDAVYVANAVSRENLITDCLFSENAGSNSVVHINLDSEAYLKLNNSIFASNDAVYNVNGTPNVILEHNWMGSTAENNDDVSKNRNVNVTNWFFLKIDAVPAMNGDATISLNNVYDGSEASTYGEYALKPITFSLGGLNSTVSVPKITLADNGQASYQFRMDRSSASLNASYGDVTTTAELKYSVADDGSFKALNEIMWFAEEGDVVELTHDYSYFDNDTITDGVVIPRKITINGNGYTIDAKGKSRIFYVPEGVSCVSISNVSFINAKSSFGSVVVISHGSDYFNFSNCNFTNNAATDYGGVIDCVGDYCTIDNCSFVNNTAVSKAGVIRYYHDTRAYIKNSNFISNRVADGSSGGGVIYVDAGELHIDKSAFISNVANDRQGSVLLSIYPATVTNSIFLNNPGSSVIYGPKVNLIDDWFGNNATDYDALPDTVNATSQKWLFLNATADALSIPDSWPKNLSFRLYSYNSTSGNVSEYSDNLFENLNLTITAANGRADKDIVSLAETFTYTPASPGKGSVTAAVENIFCTVQFDVYPRADSNLSIESPDILYGANAIIALSYNASATGKVNITLKGKNSYCTFPDMELNSSFVLDVILNSDVYNVTVAYSGDAVFSNATAGSTLTVNKWDAVISVNDSVVVTVDGSVEVGASSDSDGALSYTIADESRASVSDEGVVTGLRGGSTALIVSVAETDKYNAASVTVPVTVNKIGTVICVDYSSEAKELTATLTNAEGKGLVTANVVVSIDGADYILKTNSRGQAKFSTEGLTSGYYNATASYNGNGRYDAASETVEIFVKKSAVLTAPDVSVVYGDESGQFIATLSNDEGKALNSANVVVTLDGVDYALKTNSKGQVKVSTANLTIGTHSATVSYKGNAKYNSAAATASVAVTKKEAIISVAYDAEAQEVVAVLTNCEGKGLVTANVVISIGGVDYALKTNSKGKAKVSTANLTSGYYNVTASYKGNSKYKSASETAEIFVKKSAVITAPDVYIEYDDESGEFVATLTNGEGKALNGANLVVTLDGVDYSLKTNSKGQVKVSLANMTIGDYDAVVSYRGNAKYAPATAAAAVHVTKKAVDISLDYDAESNQIIATLTNGEGKALNSANVVVSIDDVDYALKTNSKGQVKVSTANFAFGTYTATVSYKGNSKYAPAVATTLVYI